MNERDAPRRRCQYCLALAGCGVRDDATKPPRGSRGTGKEQRRAACVRLCHGQTLVSVALSRFTCSVSCGGKTASSREGARGGLWPRQCVKPF